MWTRLAVKPQYPNKRLSHSSTWKWKKLRNSPVYTYNVFDCQNQKPDARFSEPRAVVYLSCSNPKALFDDMIIARHKNIITQFEGKEFFSFILSSRPFVTKQFLQQLWTKESQISLSIQQVDDWRIRLGLTALYDDNDAKETVQRILRLIHQVEPLPVSIFDVYTTLTEKDFVETEALQQIPFDPKYDPTYFKNSQYTLPFTGYVGNFREDDAHIRATVPMIHQCILTHDQEKIADLLKQNPESANKKDPFGIMAYELVHHLGPKSLYLLFAQARQYCVSRSTGDRHVKQFDAHCLRGGGYEAPKAEDSKKRHKKIIEYLSLYQGPTPQRSCFHQACIDGNLKEVQKGLVLSPESLDAQDPRGYTPLLLAAANGHAALVQWLIDKGASYTSKYHTNVLGTQHTLRLIENAATPEVMQVILKYHAQPFEVNNRLLLAIQEHDLLMARYLSYYLKKWPQYKGLSALELAISLSVINGTAMVETLLMSHKDPLPEGPYDVDLSAYLLKNGFYENQSSLLDVDEAVVPLLQAHNKRIENKKKKAAHYIKLSSEYLANNQIISSFGSEHLTVHAVLKRTGSLSEDERSSISMLFFNNFEMFFENTAERQQAYFFKALEDSDERPSYIHLFYHEQRLIFFMTFEYFEVDHKLIFHGKLTASLQDQTYASQNFVALVMRTAIACKQIHQDKEVLFYCKAIFPGLGLSAAIPHQNILYFPKHQHHIHKQLVEKIVAATGEQLRDEKIVAKLKLKGACRVEKNNQVLHFFKDMTGGDEKDSMPVCFAINHGVIEEYKVILERHHIDADSLSAYSALWQACMSETTLKPRAKY